MYMYMCVHSVYNFHCSVSQHGMVHLLQSYRVEFGLHTYCTCSSLSACGFLTHSTKRLVKKSSSISLRADVRDGSFYFTMANLEYPAVLIGEHTEKGWGTASCFQLCSRNSSTSHQSLDYTQSTRPVSTRRTIPSANGKTSKWSMISESSPCFSPFL